jgi:hypothetical protein
MVDLLDMMLGVGAVEAGQGGEITLSSNINNVEFRTPEDNAEAPVVPLPLTAQVPGATNETVTFGANAVGDVAFPAANTWVAGVASDAVQFPFFSFLDLGSFVPATANVSAAVKVYALVNAVQQTGTSVYTYEQASPAANALNVTITQNEATVDSDDNGLPDNAFDVTPGQIWVANKLRDGSLRTTMVANLDDSGLGKQGFTSILLQPTADVTVEVPTKDTLVTSGVMGAGEDALVVVQISSSIQSLIDEVNGDDSASARQAYADLATGSQPLDALVDGAEYVDVSIVYTTGGGSSFEELEDLAAVGLSVTLTLTGLSFTDDPSVEMWSFPTALITGGGGGVILTNTEAVGGDPASWSRVDAPTLANPNTGSISITSETLSTFAPFQSGLQLQSVSPLQIPQGFAADLTLTGFFTTRTGVYGSTAAAAIAAAQAAYTVYIGPVVAGNEASFRAVPADEIKQADFYSVTPFDGVNPNQMFVTTTQTDLGDVDVTVVENGTGISSTLAAAVQVLEVFSVTPSVTNCGQASITLSQTGSGFSLGSNNYLDGETVTADLVSPCGPDPQFAGWSVNGGALQGSAQPTGFTFTVTGDTTLEAVFEDVVTTVTIDTNVVGSADATVTLNPAGPTFTVGDAIEATTANAEVGNAFVEWQFNGVSLGNANPLNFVAAQDGTLTAVYEGLNTVTTVVQGSTNASISLNPLQPALGYADGTIITATASGAEAGVGFARWLQDGVDTGDTDPSYTFTITADTTITAVYEPIIDAPTVTSITPDNAWIFGGVVARIDGTNLDNLTSVTVGGVAVSPWDVTATSIEIAIPENTSSTADTFQVGVVVTNAAGSDSIIFTYKNVETVDGVTTDAFILGQAPLNPAAFAFRVGPVATGTVDIPQLNTVADRVFGLTQVTSTNADALETDEIPSGDDIAGVLDFAIHLYQEVAVRQNTPVAPAALFSAVSSDLIDFNSPIDPTTGEQVASTPLLLSFPIDGTALTNALVEEGVTVWGIATEYDYVADSTDVVLGSGGDIDFNTKQLTPIIRYQSTILNDEVDPDASAGADGAEPDMIMEARLYSLNAFSLRQNAVLPDAVTDGVRLQDATGTIVFDDLSGGADFTVVSSRGGLAWIDRVEYVRTGTNTVLATQQLDRVPESNRGTADVPDEFLLELTAPAVNQAGIVDIRIYLEEDAQPAIQLDRVLEYQSEVQPPTPNFLLLILGLLVAILGLAAGGDSGGGGGGPCFIATAAYGTPMASDIDALRAFRDTVLLDNAMGSALVDAYYRVSPEMANVVAQSPVLAALVRMVLVPVIFLSKMVLALPGLSLALTLGMMSVWYLRRRLRREV